MQDDTQLVTLSLSGDKQAYGRLVERYQSLVSGVCYSGTGDLALSEDLTQETFITAWTKLSELRDRAKLPNWLCVIARNLATGARRKRVRDVTRQAAPLEAVMRADLSTPAPLDRAVTREEETILWRAIEAIPDDYREPLVLYYRDGQAIASVAAALDISEDAARQRLARGRKMLRREMSAFVEKTLPRTSTKVILSAAVIAALPALAPRAAQAATVASTAAGAADAAASGGSRTAEWFGRYLHFAVFPLVVIRETLHAKSPRERRFVFLYYTFARLAFVAMLFLAFVALTQMWDFFPNPVLLDYMLVVAFVVVAGLMSAIVIWGSRRRQRIQVEDGTFTPPAFPNAPLYIAFAIFAFGSVSWAFVVARKMHHGTLAFIALAMALIMTVAHFNAHRRTQPRWKATLQFALLVSGSNVLFAYKSWDRWLAFYRQSPSYNSLYDVSSQTVVILLATVGIVATATITAYAYMGGRFSETQTPRQMTRRERIDT